MQSEDLKKEPTTSEVIAGKMTCCDTNELSSTTQTPESYPPDTVSSNLSTDEVNFEDINLEDDIERVEVFSPCSSETNDEDCATAPQRGIVSQTPEEFKIWLQRIKEMQNEIHKKVTSESISSPNATNSTISSKNNTSPPTSTSRIMNYQDLPYMGEITLENSKPRRGRKPKKADICHLIYKNYGTIFPGTPNASHYLEKDGPGFKKSHLENNKGNLDNTYKSDVQNRILSSLLEKRLTQEYKKSREVNVAHKKTNLGGKKNQNEPLNLCMRDLNQLKIRLLKNTDNTYSSEIKSEPLSDDDIEFVHEISPASIPQKGESRLSSMTPDSLPALSPNASKNVEGGSAPSGFVYWPNAGVFIHPMALQQQLMYYQRLASNSAHNLPSHNPRPPPDTIPPQPKPKELRKLVPKLKAKLPDPLLGADYLPQELKTKRNSNSNADKTPTKRKRSAIFIPPIPTENNTNPATEVSICKFKFTGGAKPSLQEKKMLSVDSGGNFRYYSGTGDKSMRGYEFFPRETLQQQANSTQGSSTGAFLQASGEKIFPSASSDINVNKVKSEFLLAPELPSSTMSSIQDINQRHKKRKSRKSLQREKLEQTFKEKGFLIQTQQLESAEGATYCKFRQLRKFTRYLFRSWKDYLPGNVREIQQNETKANEDHLELEMDNSSCHSSDITNESTGK